MSNSQQDEKRPADLRLGLKQHTLRGWQPAPEYTSVSIYFNGASASFLEELSSLISSKKITVLGDIHPQVKLVEYAQTFEKCFNGKSQKNDATRQALTPNELVGYVKIPEVKEQSPSKKPAQQSIF